MDWDPVKKDVLALYQTDSRVVWLWYTIVVKIWYCHCINSYHSFVFLSIEYNDIKKLKCKLLISFNFPNGTFPFALLAMPNPTSAALIWVSINILSMLSCAELWSVHCDHPRPSNTSESTQLLGRRAPHASCMLWNMFTMLPHTICGKKNINEPCLCAILIILYNIFLSFV